MRVTSRVDYALRAVVELANVSPSAWIKGPDLSKAAAVPRDYLETILRELRLAGLVRTQRGSDGGYALIRDADTITLADIVSAVDGVHTTPVREPADAVSRVWALLEHETDRVLRSVSVRDVASGNVPDVAAPGHAAP